MLKPLRDYGHPDLSNYVVHLTGRSGTSPDSVPANIQRMSPAVKLAEILRTREILAFEPFGGLTHTMPVVCFSECTPAGISALLRDSRYSPYGIAFHKNDIFAAGGGPVYYVRGDEWECAMASLPPAIAARCVRYWPGWADPAAARTAAEASESQWVHEREWRVVCDERESFQFSLNQVAFLIVPAGPDFRDLSSQLFARVSSWRDFARIPKLYLNFDGTVADDPHGFWLSP